MYTSCYLFHAVNVKLKASMWASSGNFEGSHTHRWCRGRDYIVDVAIKALNSSGKDVTGDLSCWHRWRGGCTHLRNVSQHIGIHEVGGHSKNRILLESVFQIIDNQLGLIRDCSILFEPRRPHDLLHTSPSRPTLRTSCLEIATQSNNHTHGSEVVLAPSLSKCRRTKTNPSSSPS